MSDLPLVIEPETPDDADDIERLNERVFGPGRFARTAYRIRETGGPRSVAEFRRPRRNPARRREFHDADRHRRNAGASPRPAHRRAGVPQPGHRRSPGEAIARGGEGGRLETRDPGRRRALLRAHRIPTGSSRPHRAARPGRSRPSALLRTRARRARGGAGTRRAAPDPRRENIDGVGTENVLPRRRFAALFSGETRDFLNTNSGKDRRISPDHGETGLEIVELPSARPPDRMADGRAGGRHLRPVASDDFLLARSAVAGAAAGRRVGDRLADEPAA